MPAFIFANFGGIIADNHKVFFLDTKITSDLKVATKPCGGIFFADGNLCDLCQVALAALCIFVDY